MSADASLSLPSALDLSGRSALVTGAGSGIGKQIAIGLAEAGADLFLCGRRPETLTRTAEELAHTGARVTAVAADVTNEGDLSQLAASSRRVDILVNNAGRNEMMPWATLRLEEWRSLMALNVEAPLRLCQLLVPYMIARGWGRVINVASIYSVISGDARNYPGVEWDIPAYVAAKHALVGLTKYLATRLATSGICVNAISPGMFATEGNETRMSTDVRQILEDRTPMGRLGDVTDVKAAAVFLSSEGARFCTGQNLIIDGGWTLW